MKNIIQSFYNDIKNERTHEFMKMTYLREEVEHWKLFLELNVEGSYILESEKNLIRLAKYYCGEKTQVEINRIEKKIKIVGENKINLEI